MSKFEKIETAIVAIVVAALVVILGNFILVGILGVI